MLASFSMNARAATLCCVQKRRIAACSVHTDRCRAHRSNLSDRAKTLAAAKEILPQQPASHRARLHAIKTVARPQARQVGRHSGHADERNQKRYPSSLSVVPLPVGACRSGPIISMMANTSDTDRRLATLMKSAQEGDQAAYARLLTEIVPVIRQAIRRQRSFLQTHDIEDILQDTLISLHRVRATYDPDRPFLPWLLTIARHRAMDSARRYVRRTTNEVAVAIMPETFSGDRANISDETYGDPAALRQAIKDLPAGQRQAIELLKLEELTLKEASAKTGLSISALKIAVHRGMKSLSSALRKRP